jgi:ABC-type lipoprotein release transport system permease subunit
MLILKIAWRNLLRHKAKSLIIGIIIFLGALIMTVGNASVIGAQKGFDENFVNRFTGHLILVSKDEEKDNVLFPFMGETLKVLQDYPVLKSMLEEQDYIEDFIPLTRGIAVLLGLEDTMWGILAFGANFEDYQRIFQNNVLLVEGRYLKNGEHGILISTGTREDIYKFTGHWVLPQDEEIIVDNLTEDALEDYQAGELPVKYDLVFMGWGGDTLNTDIRLPVIGIIRYEALNQVMKDMSLLDLESFRECFGYFTAEATIADLSAEEQTSLEIVSDDDIFGGDDIFADAVITEESYDIESIQEQTKREEGAVNLDSGAFNYISVKLKPGVSIEKGTELLNQAIEQSGTDARVIDWKTASGQVAQMAGMMQGAVSFFVFILFVVAALIIANTLSLAAMERVEELGMMRAIGALRGYFISHMFILEIFILSFVFSAIGIFVGMGCVGLLQLANIQAGNQEILHILFGGDTFQPVIDVFGLIGGVVQLVILTSLAMIYPLYVAGKIKPLDAVNRS